MTTCSICYEEFYDEDDEEKDYYDRELDISISHECETKNCDCIICHKCEMKLISDDPNNEMPFKCPMCRQNQWKHFFTTAVIICDFNDWHKETKKKLNWKIEYLREQKERIDKELQESLEKLAIYD